MYAAGLDSQQVPLLLHNTGSGWNPVNLGIALPVKGGFLDVWGSGPSDVYAVAQGVVIRYDGGQRPGRILRRVGPRAGLDAAFVTLGLCLPACSKPGAEDATPEQICDRHGTKAVEDAPLLARQACVTGFEQLRQRDPKGFECTRRCLYALSEPELAKECEPLCASDPAQVCPGLREQD